MQAVRSTEIDWSSHYDEYDTKEGMHVIERGYWCRICGEIAEPCEHIQKALESGESAPEVRPGASREP